MGKQQQRLMRGGPTLKQLGIEPATACSPLRVRPMTAEERAGFEARVAERDQQRHTGTFECKRGAGDGRQTE